jgi:hypothetical protein
MIHVLKEHKSDTCKIQGFIVLLVYIRRSSMMKEIAHPENTPNLANLVTVTQDLLAGESQFPGYAYRRKYEYPPYWKSLFRAALKLPEISMPEPDYEEDPTTSYFFYPRDEAEKQLFNKLAHSRVRTHRVRTTWDDISVSGYQAAALVDGQVVAEPDSQEDTYSVLSRVWDSEWRSSEPGSMVIYTKDAIILGRNAKWEPSPYMDAPTLPDGTKETIDGHTDADFLAIIANSLHQARH